MADSSSNPLNSGLPYQDPNNALTWRPSTWQPGQPGTSSLVDLSKLAMPSQAQIEQQRQTINANLKKYGYQPVQLTDQQVLNTMAPLRQSAVSWPDWAQSFFKQYPQYGPDANSGVARPGVDIPYDQTYSEWNLKSPGLNASQPTSVGQTYAIPRAALIYRYGLNATNQMDENWVRSHMSPYARSDVRTDYLVGSAPNFGGPNGASSNAADRSTMPPNTYY